MLTDRNTRRSPPDQWDTWVSTVRGTGGVGLDVTADAGPERKMRSEIKSVRVTVLIISFWE